MSFSANEVGVVNTGYDNRGRRHYNQAHRKTSLFGSENEEQTENKNTGDSQNNSATNDMGYNENVITNEISELYASRRNSNYEHISNEAKDSKITRTTNNADSEIDSLIEAAKARAQRREIAKSERQTATNGSIIRGRSTRNGSYGVLQAPWHTEFSDGNDKSHVNGNENTLSLKTMQLKQKTTSQADFPEYSTQELKESKLPPRRAEYKESVPWYPGSNGMNVTEDQLCLYKRSSDVIGESYVDTFGDNCRRQKTFKEKVADVAPVAASSLRSTPYAQHN